MATACTAAIVAESQPGVLHGWLAGDIDATPEPLAGALVRMLRCVFG